ncbi:MAG TPA: hypothetical protein DDZ81_26140 [Acetobacteraceae bacterium]|nr:hypothetical protein [Acetobacteraceae bacterium]
MICAPNWFIPRISGSFPSTVWSAWKITVLPEPPESRTIAPWFCSACHSMSAPALALTAVGSTASAAMPIVTP